MRRVAQNVLLALVLCASSFTAASAEKHLLVGTWKVDLARLQHPNPPKSVTLTLEEAKGGAYHVTVAIEAPDGSTSKSESTCKPDGSATRVVGSEDLDVVSMTMPSRRILVVGGGIAGHPATTRVFSLSDDGKSMIETAIRHLPDGTPYTRVATWIRQ
jgi:hypothetical protein